MGEKKLESQYINIEQAMRIYGFKYSTLRKKISAKVIPSYKPAREILIKVTDLEAYMKKCKT